MIIFLAINLALLTLSLLGLWYFLVNLSLFLTLPLIFKALIVIGLITPIMNLYDTIGNFVRLVERLTNDDEE